MEPITLYCRKIICPCFLSPCWSQVGAWARGGLSSISSTTPGTDGKVFFFVRALRGASDRCAAALALQALCRKDPLLPDEGGRKWDKINKYNKLVLKKLVEGNLYELWSWW